MNILIADDHAVVRRGLTQVLLENFKHAKIQEVSSGQGAITAASEQSFDIVILDISLPDKNGLDVLKELKLLQPKLPVIVLSFYPEDQYGLRVLKAGGAAYLSKESAPEELVACANKVLHGGKYVSPKLAEQLADAWRRNDQSSEHQGLSDRELQVLRLMAQGKTQTEIADFLCLSVKTISTYRARLLEKLNLGTTADLIRFAIENQLVN